MQNTIEQLSKEYRYETESGLLEVIVPPSEFYPDFSNMTLLVDEIFHDPPSRVKWRTKQNYDYSYLMTYSQKKGKYYLQVIYFKINSILSFRFFLKMNFE